MKKKTALFIGGTGIISTGSTNLAIERGWDVTLLRRGQHASDLIPAEAKTIVCDYNDREAAEKALAGKYFDVVVNWIEFTPDQAKKSIEIFSGKCGQYIFISSATVYERPSRQYPITESTPHNNPYSAYARNKYGCELTFMDAYRASGFPITVVRPSLTYGDTQIPMGVGSWTHPWSFVKRILDGKPVVVHGDGTGLWSFCHNTDFAKGLVGLMGNPAAVGETFHITSDEIITWDESVKCVARALGREVKIVHATSEQIARFIPGMLSNLVGDKATSAVLDTSKIKKFVPGFQCTVTFNEGMRRTIAYLSEHPELQTIDEEWDRAIDAIVKADEAFRP